MVASGSRTTIAGSLSSCTAGFHQSCRSSQSSGPRRSFVGIGRLSLLLALEVAPIGRAIADRHGAAPGNICGRGIIYHRTIRIDIGSDECGAGHSWSPSAFARH